MTELPPIQSRWEMDGKPFWKTPKGQVATAVVVVALGLGGADAVFNIFPGFGFESEQTPSATPVSPELPVTAAAPGQEQGPMQGGVQPGTLPEAPPSPPPSPTPSPKPIEEKPAAEPEQEVVLPSPTPEPVATEKDKAGGGEGGPSEEPKATDTIVSPSPTPLPTYTPPPSPTATRLPTATQEVALSLEQAMGQFEAETGGIFRGEDYAIDTNVGVTVYHGGRKLPLTAEHLQSLLARFRKGEPVSLSNENNVGMAAAYKDANGNIQNLPASWSQDGNIILTLSREPDGRVKIWGSPGGDAGNVFFQQGEGFIVFIEENNPLDQEWAKQRLSTKQSSRVWSDALASRKDFQKRQARNRPPIKRPLARQIGQGGFPMEEV